MKILFIADVFGSPGRRTLEQELPGLREKLAIDFCLVNAENATDGAGLTPKHAERILAAGADAITLGNHVWRRPEIVSYLRARASGSFVRRTSRASSPGRA